MSADKYDQELLSKIEKASHEEAKDLILNSLNPNCRTVGSKFFSCVEENMKMFDNKKISFEDLEREVNNSILPKCTKEFNLEACLKQYENQH
jgi:hypothetical protein